MATATGGNGGRTQRERRGGVRLPGRRRRRDADQHGATQGQRADAPCVQLIEEIITREISMRLNKRVKKLERAIGNAGPCAVCGGQGRGRFATGRPRPAGARVRQGHGRRRIIIEHANPAGVRTLCALARCAAARLAVALHRRRRREKTKLSTSSPYPAFPAATSVLRF
jgi:hypothetical protein